jgi:hypothetical protein
MLRSRVQLFAQLAAGFFGVAQVLGRIAGWKATVFRILFACAHVVIFADVDPTVGRPETPWHAVLSGVVGS